MTDAVRKGLAAYDHEQRLLLRYLRRYGSFTGRQFDRWFYSSRRCMGWMAQAGITGNTFLLGGTGHTRDAMLHLMQFMIGLGDIVTACPDDEVVYFLPPSTAG